MTIRRLSFGSVEGPKNNAKQVNTTQKETKTPQKEDKQMTTATKLMIGATAVAGLVALGIAGRKGVLGKNVQKWLGGEKKIAGKGPDKAPDAPSGGGKGTAAPDSKTTPDVNNGSKKTGEQKTSEPKPDKATEKEKTTQTANNEKSASATATPNYIDKLKNTKYSGQIKSGDSVITLKDGEIVSCVDSSGKQWKFTDSAPEYQKGILEQVNAEVKKVQPQTNQTQNVVKNATENKENAGGAPQAEKTSGKDTKQSQPETAQPQATIEKQNDKNSEATKGGEKPKEPVAQKPETTSNANSGAEKNGEVKQSETKPAEPKPEKSSAQEQTATTANTAKPANETTVPNYVDELKNTKFSGSIKSGSSVITLKDGEIVSCVDESGKHWNFTDSLPEYQKGILEQVKTEVKKVQPQPKQIQKVVQKTAENKEQVNTTSQTQKTAKKGTKQPQTETAQPKEKAEK